MAKQLVEIAAQIYSCKVEELLSYREYEDGSVVIIAPSGQKFAYSAEQIMKRILENAEESSKATVPIAAPFEKGGEEMVSEVGQASADPVTKEAGGVVTPVTPAAAPEVTKSESAPVVTGAPDPGGAGVTKKAPARKKRAAKS